MDDASYAVESLNKVNRYNHQATYDYATIHGIVNTTPVLHVSFLPAADEPFPVILPMIGQMGLYPHAPDASTPLDQPLDCYLHGYVSSRLMRTSSTTSSDEGLPVCVAATKVDGLVLSLTPNTHNYNYRSAVLHGHATPVTDPAEKLWAMRLVTDSVVPGRWAHTRVPPDGAEMQSTALLRVRVRAASGKVRAGVPEDERKDLRREEVLDTVWTGVLPWYETVGEPVPGPYNRVKEVPAHVREFVEGVREERRRYAVEMASVPAPVKRKKRAEEE